MRKHVLGLIFFLSIISLFAAVYSVFRTYPIPDVEVVDVSDGDASSDVRFPERDHHDIRVTQAIADPHSKSLAFSLANGSSSVTEVEFDFYNISEDGVRFVRSEVITISPDQWASGIATGVIKYKTNWLGSKQITDNLYVVAGASQPERGSYELLPFTKDKATAVLIAKN